jgi:CubicO group peptidase (beta-lactamase class C family)
MKRMVLAVAVILTLGPAALSQVGAAAASDQTAARVDALFAKWNKADSPGCALAVIKEGRIIYERGYGMANLEYDTPITPSSVFYAGSVSKQFAAMSIALLARQGKLKLDDNIHKYLPELPDYNPPITIRHLIHHTSGLRDGWELIDLAGRRTDDPYDMDDILELTKRQAELNFTPGEHHLYSNTGYWMLALIVKRASGQTLAEYAEENIFKPLGMSHSRFNDDHTSILKNRAVGYAPGKEGGFRLDIVNNDLVGAGGLWTTVEDLALWDQNFYSGKVGGPAVIEELLTPGVLNNGDRLDYAFGLVVGRYKGLREVDHGGSLAGYRADLIRFPDQQFSAVCMCNFATASPGSLTKQVADIYLAGQLKTDEAAAGENWRTPEETGATSAPPISAEQLADKAGIYWNSASEEAMRLYVNEGNLTLAIGQGQTLVPVSYEHFKLRGQAVDLFFDRPDRRGPLKLREVGLDSNPAIYEAVQPKTLSAAEMNELAGRYYAKELDARYVVMVQDGKLILRRKRSSDLVLYAMFADTFMNEDLGTLRFARDSRNRVAGFMLNAGRVKHIRFLRESDGS